MCHVSLWAYWLAYPLHNDKVSPFSLACLFFCHPANINASFATQCETGRHLSMLWNIDFILLFPIHLPYINTIQRQETSLVSFFLHVYPLQAFVYHCFWLAVSSTTLSTHLLSQCLGIFFRSNRICYCHCTFYTDYFMSSMDLFCRQASKTAWRDNGIDKLPWWTCSHGHHGYWPLCAVISNSRRWSRWK